jgi:hypothetical protein
MASAYGAADLWRIAGAALAAALVAAILLPMLVRAWRRQKPIRLAILEPRPLIAPNAFADSIDIGNFGELLVGLWLAKDGWKQLPSKTGSGGQGLDGLFLRERRKAKGIEALAIEVKTNNSPYRPEQMTDERVKKTLQELYALEQLGEETTTALVGALDARSRHFRKQYWNPNLATGRMEYCDLDAKGNRGRCKDLKNTARFIEALALGARQFDRERRYIR